MSAQRGIARRTFLLGSAAAWPMAWGIPDFRKILGGTAGAAPPGDAGATGGLIVRQKEPENLESPFASLSSYITPNQLFYVRSHFAVPRLDVRTWRLKVEGAVSRELELTCAELRKLPKGQRRQRTQIDS